MGSFGHGRDLARDSVMGGSRNGWGHTLTAPTAAEWPPASTSRDLGPGARQQMVGGTTFPLADQEGLLHFRRQTACETPTELLIHGRFSSLGSGWAVVSISVPVVSAAETVTVSHVEGCGSTARCGSDVESGVVLWGQHFPPMRSERQHCQPPLADRRGGRHSEAVGNARLSR